MVSDGKKYELIPPEGGWGHLVLCGLIILMVCGIGSVPTLGLIFSDFLIDIGATADTVAVIISFYFISFNFSGSPHAHLYTHITIIILSKHLRFTYEHFT